MRNHRRLVLGAALLSLAMLAGACGSGGDETESPTSPGTTAPPTTTTSPTETSKGAVTVGVSAAFAENQIVAEMYAQVLENAGFEVSRELDFESREISQPAMENGEIDIKPEYLGSLLVFLGGEARGNANENASLLRPLLEEQQITLLDPSAANDTNVFVVTQETADANGLAIMSDLVPVAGDLTLGGPPECPDRPFCIPGLAETYGITFGEFIPLDFGGRVAALQSGDIDVALLFSTDAVIGENGWVPLRDDGALQQNEAITPVVRTEVLDANPEIADLLNAVSARLDTPTMIELNGRVQIEHEDAADVAADFLTEQGLI
jgi:osmoprotectant transport system substrate-binding protein